MNPNQGQEINVRNYRDTNSNYISIQAIRDVRNEDEVHLWIEYENKFDNYYPLHIHRGFPAAGYWNWANMKRYDTDSIIGGSLTVLRFDTATHIISGTFEFKCVNKETHDTLNVTDGRFDTYFGYW